MPNTATRGDCGHRDLGPRDRDGGRGGPGEDLGVRALARAQPFEYELLTTRDQRRHQVVVDGGKQRERHQPGQQDCPGAAGPAGVTDTECRLEREDQQDRKDEGVQ